MRVLLLILLVSSTAFGQTRTVGLINHDATASYQGYTLFAPVTSNTTYLIDNEGYVVKTWQSTSPPGQAVMLLEDGTLLRTGMPFVQEMGGGGAGGVVEKIAWDGTVLWRYQHYGTTYRSHHDVEILPNGNILLIVWESHTREEAIAKGRDPNRLTENALWSERIIEVKQTGPTTGEVVWDWSSWDNMVQNFDSSKPDYGVVSEHPDRLHINAGGTRSDWLHLNAVRYNAKRDEVMVSVHNLHEFFIVSRATGKIVYRWGNPQIYGRGDRAAQQLYGQHDARWLDEDGTRIMVFNNGQNRSTTQPRSYSTVEIIEPPMDNNGQYVSHATEAFGPSEPTWTHPKTPNAQFFATNVSGATLLPNGNVLTCLGPQGTFVEVTASGSEVWRYVNPVSQSGITTQGQTPRNNMVFKIYRYSADYPAFAGKKLQRMGRLEEGPLSVSDQPTMQATADINVVAGLVQLTVPEPQRVNLGAYDLLGRFLGTVVNQEFVAGTYTLSVPRGTFLVVRL